MKIFRRDFLKGSVWPLWGFGLQSPERKEAAEKVLQHLPFVDQKSSKLGTVSGTGLGKRLAFDLSLLRPGAMVVPNELFYIRTGAPGLLRRKRPWSVEFRGQGRHWTSRNFVDLAGAARPLGTFLMECAGNGRHRSFGLMSSAEWSGIPLRELLEDFDPTLREGKVLVSGLDPGATSEAAAVPGASWIFDLRDLRTTGAFLATEMNQVPLSADHGWPLRLVVPGWYGCSCIKWVDGIRRVDEWTQATPQMREYAGRTHQDGSPRMARDYRPATIDSAAMPVRVEKRLMRGQVYYRIAGIVWGGSLSVRNLLIRLGRGEKYLPVKNYRPTHTTTWSLWSHDWQPVRPGRYSIYLRIGDREASSRRLDSGFYVRQVDIDEV